MKLKNGCLSVVGGLPFYLFGSFGEFFLKVTEIVGVVVGGVFTLARVDKPDFSASELNICAQSFAVKPSNELFVLSCGFCCIIFTIRFYANYCRRKVGTSWN